MPAINVSKFLRWHGGRLLVEAKFWGYGGSKVVKLKPKGCDRRALLGVKSAGSFYSTRGISPGSDMWCFDRLRTFLILWVVVNGLPPFVEQLVWTDSLSPSNKNLNFQFVFDEKNLCFHWNKLTYCLEKILSLCVLKILPTYNDTPCVKCRVINDEASGAHKGHSSKTVRHTTPHLSWNLSSLALFFVLFPN